MSAYRRMIFAPNSSTLKLSPSRRSGKRRKRRSVKRTVLKTATVQVVTAIETARLGHVRPAAALEVVVVRVTTVNGRASMIVRKEVRGRRGRTELSALRERSEVSDPTGNAVTIVALAMRKMGRQVQTKSIEASV